MKRYIFSVCVSALLLIFGSVQLFAQKSQTFKVVEDKSELEKIVPASFFFAGLSGKTQKRNAAVGMLGEGRHVLAGLVDVSGYSTDISGVYEGFFITDSDVRFGDQELKLGAYGFGFAKDQTVNLFDLAGKKIYSVATTTDEGLQRPRPLMMSGDDNGIRLYKGKDYVLIRP